MVLRKDELEVQLKDEHQLIRDGVLRDDSPLDVSQEFQKLCHACRVADLKGCQEAIATGVNINARDQFDYTPLILVSRGDNPRCHSQRLSLAYLYTAGQLVWAF
jgi:ankyrin repeat/BTB/POZ domain-containing protein 1